MPTGIFVVVVVVVASVELELPRDDVVGCSVGSKV